MFHVVATCLWKASQGLDETTEQTFCESSLHTCPMMAHLLLPFPFQQSSSLPFPAAILSSLQTLLGREDQNFLACFNFSLTSVTSMREREKKKKHLCKNPKLPNRCAFRLCQKYLQSLSVVWREKCRFWLGQKFVQVFPNHFVVFVYLLVLFTYWSPQYFYVKCIKSPKELIN